jgi:hypothetical protein
LRERLRHRLGSSLLERRTILHPDLQAKRETVAPRRGGGLAERSDRQSSADEGSVDREEDEGLGENTLHGKVNSDVIRPLNSELNCPFQARGDLTKISTCAKFGKSSRGHGALFSPSERPAI